MKKYSFIEVSANEFHEYTQKKLESSSFQQTVNMAETLKKQYWECNYVAVVDPENSEILLSALLISKKMFGGIHMECNYGPVYVQYSDSVFLFFIEELKKYAHSKNVFELILRPNIDAAVYNSQGDDREEVHIDLREKMIQQGFKRDVVNDVISWQYVKDLSEYNSYNSLFKTFTKDGQYSIKKTRQFGISVRKMKYDELNKFKDITQQTADRLGYEDKSLKYYQDLFETFGDSAEFLVSEINFKEYKNRLLEKKGLLEENLKKIDDYLKINPDSRKKNNQRKEQVSEISTYDKRIIEAEELIKEYGSEDIMLSVALFIYSPSEVVYLFSGSDVRFKKLYAPFAIQEHVMKKAVELEIPRYNFYGISGTFDGNDGVLGFKQNFNGFVEEKIGDFIYHSSDVLYKIIKFGKSIIGRK